MKALVRFEAEARRAAAARDVVFVALATSASIYLVARAVAPIHGIAACLLPLSVALGLLLADLTSAAVHWFGDTFLDVETPVVGRAFIAPFREHHREPAAFLRHGIWQRNGHNCRAMMPLLVIACFSTSRANDFATSFFGPAFAVAAATLCWASQIHAWAHDPDAPHCVRWLQRVGLLLAPEHHAAHHRASHGHAYAIVNGWSNRWLDRVAIFRRTEMLVACVMFRWSRPASPRAEDR